MLRRSGPLSTLPGRALRLAALCVLALSAGCVQRAPTTGPLARFAEFAGREVKSVELTGDLVVPADSLRRLLATRPTRCGILFIPVCPFGFGRVKRELDVEELGRDIVRIQLFHRDHGYYGTRVLPQVEPVGDDQVEVRFAIAPGDLVTTREVVVEGTDSIVPAEEVERRLPLKEGEPFRRTGFLASADTVRSALLARGYAYAEVLRNYSIDTIADVAEANFGAIPGPLVRVDTILVLGTDRLARRTILKQLAFRQGDVLVSSRLSQSQRNLYDLGLVNFAAVQLAPDSLQVDPDSANATVVVRVVEAPRYLAESSAGYGTLDCFRTQARVVDRNFLGGARRLELNGSLSKIGTGEPLGAGLENSLCSQLAEDPYSQHLNYSAAATFVQPRLFGTRTSTTVNLHAERLSEYQAYLRTSRGGQLAALRQIGPQTTVTGAFNVERGQTEAPDIFFCVALLVCEPGEIQPLRESRWSNSLALALSRDRTVQREFPVGGYQARGTVDWASALLGSNDRYLRLLGDGAAYREVRTGWVLAGRVMGGAFVERLFEESGFIPPERRFYAGGPTTVRGVPRNTLGPTLYVTEDPVLPGDSGFTGEFKTVRPAATGGTGMVVGSVELRMPSPVLREYTRLAAFVDAGKVWAQDSLTIRGESYATPTRLTITPGVGARFYSPVGPIRVDLGFNPYGAKSGPLVGFDPQTGELIPLGRHRPEADGFWEGLQQRIQIYIAVGQAF